MYSLPRQPKLSDNNMNYLFCPLQRVTTLDLVCIYIAFQRIKYGVKAAKLCWIPSRYRIVMS